MLHETSLIYTIATGFVFALGGGYLAARLRLPTLVGYLFAGIAIGPFTPGIVADPKISAQLADIGVILLMFGVGIHFSFRELLAVWRIAVPGAISQIVLAVGLGVFTAHFWGWPLGASLVLGLALSVASTVVLMRELEGRGALSSAHGHIVVGWLVVEDLVTVLVLVLLPVFATALGGEPLGHGAYAERSLILTLGITVAKLAAFTLVMLVAGARFLPWLLEQIAQTDSRELFTLAVIAIALGVAFGSAELFGVSFALGAFFAGVLVNQSDHSQRAALESRALQEAFTVLFFVSVGMLFDPAIVAERASRALCVLLIIVAGKSLGALAIVLSFRYSMDTALTVAAGLAQIGEFSFILGEMGVALKLMPREGASLIVVGALLSITLNPLIFRIAHALQRAPVNTPARIES